MCKLFVNMQNISALFGLKDIGDGIFFGMGVNLH